MLWWIFATENDCSTYVSCMLHHPNWLHSCKYWGQYIYHHLHMLVSKRLKEENNVEKWTSLDWSNSRVAHVEPTHDDVQVHVFGAVQVPLLRQTEVHTAEKHARRDSVEQFTRTYVSHIVYLTMRLCMYTYYQHYTFLHSHMVTHRLLK